MQTGFRKALAILARDSNALFFAHERLVAHGVSPADAEGREAAMTDEEAAIVARDIDSLPAGGWVALLVGVLRATLLAAKAVGKGVKNVMDAPKPDAFGPSTSASQ